MYPFYLGIDLHKDRTYLVLMNSTGEIEKKKQLANEQLKEYISEEIPYETCAVMEATRNWAFLYEILEPRVAKAVIAHPKRLKAIASARVKTDRIDAKTLAHLARLNYLPEAYAAPQEVRDLRLYVRHRASLVRQRTQVKNRLIAILIRYNLKSPVSDLFGKEGREYIKAAIQEVRPIARRVITEQLELIDIYDERIAALEEVLELTPEQKRISELLQTVPGIGKIHAITIVAEIGEFQRFNNSKALCHWVGLTPKVRKSDQVEYHGRISKEGSPYLRGALTQAAAIASRINPKWREVHERLEPRCGKKGAKTAIARRLLTVIYYMLKRDQPYQENYSS